MPIKLSPETIARLCGQIEALSRLAYAVQGMVNGHCPKAAETLKSIQTICSQADYELEKAERKEPVL